MFNFDNVQRFLKRFEYSEATTLGFCYFLGLTALVAKGEETTITDIQNRLAQLPTVDIDGEIDSLLGPLDDRDLYTVFDELVWRFRGEFEPREIKVSKTAEPVFVYKFRNHGRIFSDTRKVDDLHSAEEIFSEAMRMFGRPFQESGYDPVKCFKTGLIIANLRIHADTKTSHASFAFVEKFLPLVFGAAHRMARAPFIDWSQHLDVQVPLQVFLTGVNPDLGEVIWAYQSHIHYKDGNLKPGVTELNDLDYMAGCKEAAITFFEKYPTQCIELASQKFHWNSFSPFRNGFDERDAILDVIHKTLGYSSSEKSSYSDQCTLKALIIFGYFCSLCETILLEQGKTQEH